MTLPYMVSRKKKVEMATSTTIVPVVTLVSAKLWLKYLDWSWSSMNID